MSQNGIPKLRRITKDRLKFKGKGHEVDNYRPFFFWLSAADSSGAKFSDVARILNLYQLWLDDLYPKAKFADGLAMIEKLGHSKRIQTMRKEWINEAKTGRDCESKSPDSDTFANTTGGFGGRDSTQPEVEDTQDGNKLPSGEQREEDSLFVDENGNLLQSSEPDGDELDEPIAEARDLTDIASGRNNHKKSDRAPGTKDAFEERYATEMEMMREFEDW